MPRPVPKARQRHLGRSTARPGPLPRPLEADGALLNPTPALQQARADRSRSCGGPNAGARWRVAPRSATPRERPPAARRLGASRGPGVEPRHYLTLDGFPTRSRIRNVHAGGYGPLFGFTWRDPRHVAGGPRPPLAPGKRMRRRTVWCLALQAPHTDVAVDQGDAEAERPCEHRLGLTTRVPVA